MHQIALERREAALHHRVVPAVAGATHAGHRPDRREGVPIRPTGVRAAAIRMVQQAACGLPQRDDVLPLNRVRAYKFTAGKDELYDSPDEYTEDEFKRLRAAMRFRDPGQRRAHVILSLLGLQGPRIGAVLHLTWADVDWREKTITWRARYDKLGREWHQKMRTPTQWVLRRYWCACGRPTRGWLFPSDHPRSRRQVYSYQSFLDALRLAERRAGIEYRPYRGPHGFRRMVAGDVAVRSGSAWKAMQVSGDKDVRQAERYLKRRKAVTAKNLDLLDAELIPAPPLDEPAPPSSSSRSSSQTPPLGVAATAFDNERATAPQQPEAGQPPK